MSDLDKPPARELQDDAYRALLESEHLDDLLPSNGSAIVLKPTANDGDDLASACLRVRVVSDSTEARNSSNEHTLMVQVQIDWTAEWHRDSGPTWEVDVRSAITDELSRLGGASRSPLGGGGATDADFSEELGRYLGDTMYRYRVADVSK